MKKLCMVLLVFLPITCAKAIKVSDLYQVELPVIAQSQDLKEEAMKEGLLQVFIKLTGDPFIEKNPTIKLTLQKADYYVQEFGYASANTSSYTYLMQIHYDSSSINRLLKKAGILYWGEMRPLILVWLSVTHADNTMEIVGNDAHGKLVKNIKFQGKKYGLPLIFPMMDIHEVNQISAAPINTMALTVLNSLSKRYSPDALLIGHVEENESGLESQWQLLLKNKKWNWVITGHSINELISSLMDKLNQTLAKHYIITKAKPRNSHFLAAKTAFHQHLVENRHHSNENKQT